MQLQKRTANAAAFTLAQFLLGSKRYDPDTGRYLVTDAADRERGYKTVIIDESSMLTEDQLAATFDAIEAQAGRTANPGRRSPAAAADWRWPSVR